MGVFSRPAKGNMFDNEVLNDPVFLVPVRSLLAAAVLYLDDVHNVVKDVGKPQPRRQAESEIGLVRSLT